METLLEKVGDIQVIHLRGRLDLATTPAFEDVLQGLIQSGEKKIVLDCRDLKYVSSTGLGAFIAGGKGLGDHGKLVFAALSTHIQSLFDMTGIAPLFKICATKDDAVREFEAA